VIELVEVENGKMVLDKGGIAEGKPFIVVGIPAFNEEKTIAKVVLQAKKYAHEVVVCDDGSSDLTGEIAWQMGAVVVRHEQNLGYGAAIQSLFKHARKLDANVFVTLDGDGQHNPSEIPLLVEPVLDGKADVVIGSRFLDDWEKKNSVPRYRRIGIKVITKLTGAASNHRFSDAQSGFRVYGRKALKSLSLNENGMGLSVEILMEAKKHGLNIVEVPTGCNYHGLGRTSTHGSLRHGTSVIMSLLRLVVEKHPLIFLGIPGAVSILLGIFFGFWMFEIYTIEQRIVTNVALASIAFILIGSFAVFTAITLYAITRLAEKMAK